jgi:ABC-type transport system substrate-binding protein
MKKHAVLILLCAALGSGLLAGCGSSAGSSTSTSSSGSSASAEAATGTSTEAAGETLGDANIDTTTFLKFADDNPDIVDPQCTSDYYTIPMNCFDRLLEVKVNDDGTSEIVPSLAKSYEVSDDGLTYTFHLNEGVKYSNGADLTSSDVLYTFNRLLTYPKAVNNDIAEGIKGADQVENGEASSLEDVGGFTTIDDLDFSITLSQPNASFLAQLTVPGASILDEDTTEAAGDQFGIDPSVTIGTGPFIFSSWTFNSELILTANKNCWSGAPACDGLDIKVVPDEETQRMMFENGELDILDLDNTPSQADYFLGSDKYKDEIIEGPRVGIYYISLNEDIEPMGNVEVRKAMQESLDRQSILDALYGGRGQLENGILPHGLVGYNENLPEIPYDVEDAKKLLADAGYANGFDLELDVSSDDSQTSQDLMQIVASMWGEIGINCTINTMDDATLQDTKHAGELSCYSSSWSADYNDPDNFMYTFFGDAANAKFRSLNYKNTDAMARVTAARAITNPDKRIAEYQDLEKTIIQDDAAWVPLFSKEHLYVVSPAVSGFKVSWNGWSNNYYHNVSVTR